MTSTTGNLRRLMFSGDRAASSRREKLNELARFIADNTSPVQPLRLTVGDQARLKLYLPRTPLWRSLPVLISMVSDLHSARQAEDREANGDVDWDDPSPDEFYRSAAGLARDAVQADLTAGAR